MATPRKEGRDYGNQDNLLEALEAANLEPGKDFKYKTVFGPEGEALKVSLQLRTSAARKFFTDDNKRVKEIMPKEVKDVVIGKRSKNGVVVHYVDAEDRKVSQSSNGTETRKRKSSPQKRARYKVSHREVANGRSQRKRLRKLWLPRNTGQKPHVKLVFDVLNSEKFTDKERAECVETVAKFATKVGQTAGKSTKLTYLELKKKLKARYAVVDLKDPDLGKIWPKVLKRKSVDIDKL